MVGEVGCFNCSTKPEVEPKSGRGRNQFGQEPGLPLKVWMVAECLEKLIPVTCTETLVYTKRWFPVWSNFFSSLLLKAMLCCLRYMPVFQVES